MTYQLYLTTGGGGVKGEGVWAGALYTKSIASLELRHKEHNNDLYSLHNNTIERGNSAYIDLVY